MGKPILNNSGNRNYSKGKYQIKNVDKYIGNLNECLYRSSWELKFMIYCDNSNDIRKWGSETAEVKYFAKNDAGQLTPHRYFPDFYIEKINPKNPHDFNTYYLEIKPFKEYKPDFIIYDSDGSLKILPPEKNSRKALENWEYQVKTFEKNLIKWKAADEFCKKRNMEFKVAHEYILKEWGVLNETKR